jgi:hypothetical protein
MHKENLQEVNEKSVDALKAFDHPDHLRILEQPAKIRTQILTVLKRVSFRENKFHSGGVHKRHRRWRSQTGITRSESFQSWRVDTDDATVDPIPRTLTGSGSRRLLQAQRNAVITDTRRGRRILIPPYTIRVLG